MTKNRNLSYDEGRIEELGRRIGTGDRDAYAQVFRMLHAPLVRYARSITTEDASAYDVLQDVFLKFWEKRESLSAHTSLKAMLYTMVRNRALNARRDRARRHTGYDQLTAENKHVGGSADDRVMATDLSGHIIAWIDDLPERQAEAFRLSRYSGLTHHEISLVMNVSERTVGTHILLALKQLRNRLAELEK